MADSLTENNDLATFVSGMADLSKVIQNEISPIALTFENMFRNSAFIETMAEVAVQEREMQRRLSQAMLPMIEAQIAFNEIFHSKEFLQGFSEIIKQQQEIDRSFRLIMKPILEATIAFEELLRNAAFATVKGFDEILQNQALYETNEVKNLEESKISEVEYIPANEEELLNTEPCFVLEVGEEVIETCFSNAILIGDIVWNQVNDPTGKQWN